MNKKETVEKHIRNLKQYIKDDEIIEKDRSDFSNFCKGHIEDIEAVLAKLEKKDKLLKCIFKNERLDCYDLRLNIEPENQDCRHIGDFSCKECIEKYFEKKVGE